MPKVRDRDGAIRAMIDWRDNVIKAIDEAIRKKGGSAEFLLTSKGKLYHIMIVVEKKA